MGPGNVNFRLFFSLSCSANKFGNLCSNYFMSMSCFPNSKLHKGKKKIHLPYFVYHLQCLGDEYVLSWVTDNPMGMKQRWVLREPLLLVQHPKPEDPNAAFPSNAAKYVSTNTCQCTAFGSSISKSWSFLPVHICSLRYLEFSSLVHNTFQTTRESMRPWAACGQGQAMCVYTTTAAATKHHSCFKQ